MSEAKTKKIGVVGAGIMGRGIVQLFAQSGYSVYLFDASDKAVAAGLAYVGDMVDKLVGKGKLSAVEGSETKQRLIPCAELSDLSSCDLVIEAVVENIDVKRSLFVELEAVVSTTAILASNTSSLLIADIASACSHPGRVAGLHFFNPVPLMKVAEVISSVRTDANVIRSLKSLLSSTGHRPVVAEDQPGFLVNHAGRGLYTEGLRLLEEHVTTPAEIDRTLRQAADFRMGPFELLDLTGLDVSGKVMESIYQQFQQEPLFRPSSLVATRISAGLFGRKTGEGWYQYVEGKKQAPDRPAVPSTAQKFPVWIDPDAPQAEGLRALVEQADAELVDTTEEDALLVIQPLGSDATSSAISKDLDATRVVAIDPLVALEKHRTLMLTPVTKPMYRDFAHMLFTADDTALTLIHDSPGFIVQRTLAMIINIATHIAQRKIAQVEDIEAAVTLGLGYPRGPLTWGDDLGVKNVLAVLDGMCEVTKDPRYRATHWLRRRAMLGVSLLTEDTVLGAEAA